MARLPTPGKDAGNWGNILNDFLTQAHQADGSLKPVTSIANGTVTPTMTDGGFERTANKGVANGYAALDSTGKIPAGQMPLTSNLVDPAILSFYCDPFQSGDSSHVLWSPALEGYLVPPLPSWLTINNTNDLVFSQAGIYSCVFGPYISNSPATTYFSLFSNLNGSIGLTSYTDPAPLLNILIYVRDDGFADMISALSTGSGSSLILAETNSPLILTAYGTHTGGGANSISASGVALIKIQ